MTAHVMAVHHVHFVVNTGCSRLSGELNCMSDQQRFLTPDDLYSLTGYRRPSLQCKALKESGVFFICRKDGRPGTTWDHVSNPVGLRVVAVNPEEEEPNFKDM